MLRTLSIFLIATMVLLTFGCASNSALTLKEASKHAQLIVPSAAVIKQQITGNSIHVGETFQTPEAVVKTMDNYPADLFRRLLEQQINKGFVSAGLEMGVSPPLVLDVFIEEMKFTKGNVLIPDSSILRVSIQLRSDDGLPRHIFCAKSHIIRTALEVGLSRRY